MEQEAAATKPAATLTSTATYALDPNGPPPPPPTAVRTSSTLASRRAERHEAAAAARAAAERARQEDDATRAGAEKMAEERRAAAAKKAKDVAFGRKVAKPPKHPGSKATGRKGLATEVRPFNLSVGNKPKPTANAAPAKKRDPDVWEDPNETSRFEDDPSAQRGTPSKTEEKKRTLEDVFADAARAKEAEALRERERIRSKEAVRQSLIVSIAAKVAAPAIAAAEAAQRNASEAAEAATKAAAAAAAAERLLLAETKRLRQRRAELLGAGPSGEGEGECEEGTSRETFASSEGGGEEDDAPLMASTSDLPGLIARSGAFYTLVPIRPRSRGERRSLRTLPGASLRPPPAFNPRPRCLSTPPDAFQLHPDRITAPATPRRRSSGR